MGCNGTNGFSSDPWKKVVMCMRQNKGFEFQNLLKVIYVYHKTADEQ